MSASAIFHAFHVTLRENGQSSESSHGELPLPLLSVAGEKSPFWADWFGYKFVDTPFGWACNIATQSSVSQLTSLSYTQQGLFRSISTIKTPISSCFIKKKKKRPCVLLGIENTSHLNKNLSILTAMIQNYPNLDLSLPPSFYYQGRALHFWW